MTKILYVEDNDDNVYMLRGRLTRAGFEVAVATDGEQGVAMAASETPDLILMDLTDEDRRRLNGEVERVMQKGAYDRDALLREVGRVLAACVARGER